MKKRILVPLISIILFCAIAVAQENSIDELLWGDNLYVVTASKKKEHVSDAPATVIVITDQMIKERNYRDLKDVFNDLPGFDISTNVYGEFSTLISQRGISGNNKIVLLLDGIRITPPSGKQFQYGNNVPVYHLKKIEIVYGPASALYGADAFAVINLISPENNSGVQADVSGGPDGTFDVSLFLEKKINPDISVKGYFRNYVTDGPDLTQHYPELAPEYSGFMYGYHDPVDDLNLFFNIQVKNLSLTFHRSNFREQLAKGLEPDNHYLYSEDAFWGSSLFELALSHRCSGDKYTIKTDAVYTKFEIDPEMNWVYYSEWTPDHKQVVHQYGLTEKFHLESQLDYKLADNLNGSIGVSESRFMGLPTGDKNGDPFDTRGPLRLDNFYNDVYPQAAIQAEDRAVYVQFNFQPLEALHFILGDRLDHNSHFGSVHNPRLGIIYRFQDNALKLMAGKAYIAPGYFHRNEAWFATDYGHIQNFNLRPERLQTIEASWTQHVGDKLKTSVSGYYNQATDLIVRKGYGLIDFRQEWYAAGAGWVDANGDSTVFVEWNTNFGELRSYGIDVTADYMYSRAFKLFSAYSYMDGEETDPETGIKLDLSKTSRHKLSFGFTLTVFEKLSITPRMRWVSQIATRLENSLYGVDRNGDYLPESPHEKMPGYKLVNLNLYYRDIFPRLNAHFAVNNLLNEKYYTAGVATEGSGTYLPRVPQNMRSFLIGLNYQFHW